MIKIDVLYSGSDSVQIGQGLCYDSDERKTVSRPAPDNEHRFAGVSAYEYPAKRGGQTVKIYPPQEPTK